MLVLIVKVNVGAQDSHPLEINNGAINLVIERIEKRAWAGDWTPRSGMTYLTIYGIVTNPYQEKAEIEASQVSVRLDGKEYEPHDGIMDRIKDNIGGLDYIGSFPIEVFPGETRSIFIAFEVPTTWGQLEIVFDGQAAKLLSSNSIAVDLVAPTATLTPTPTSTPLPAATPGGLPFLDDGKTRWVIERFETHPKAGDWTPLKGMVYLAVFGTVSNVGSGEANFSGSRVQVRVDGKDYYSHDGIMDRLRDDFDGMNGIESYPYIDGILPGQTRSAFVAFEIPKTWQQLGVTMGGQVVWLENVETYKPTATYTPLPTHTATQTFTPTITYTPSQTPPASETFTPTATPISAQSTTDGVNSRSCPSTSCDIVRVVSARDIFAITGTYDDWYGVEFADGERAYIRGDFVSLPVDAVVVAGPTLTNTPLPTNTPQPSSTPRPTNTPRSTATDVKLNLSEHEILSLIKTLMTSSDYPIDEISRSGSEVIIVAPETIETDTYNVATYRVEYFAYALGALVKAYDGELGNVNPPTTITMRFELFGTVSSTLSVSYQDAKDFIDKQISAETLLRRIQVR